MVAASEEMSELVHQQDRKQRQRKWQAAGESGWLVIQQGEVVQEFFKRQGFAVGIGDRELGAGHETGAESDEE